MSQAKALQHLCLVSLKMILLQLIHKTLEAKSENSPSVSIPGFRRASAEVDFRLRRFAT